MDKSTNLNIRIDKNVKEQSEKIFDDLGLNMSTAINMFLRQVIRVNGIPFDIKRDSSYLHSHKTSNSYNYDDDSNKALGS